MCYKYNNMEAYFILSKTYSPPPPTPVCTSVGQHLNRIRDKTRGALIDQGSIHKKYRKYYLVSTLRNDKACKSSNKPRSPSTGDPSQNWIKRASLRTSREVKDATHIRPMLFLTEGMAITQGLATPPTRRKPWRS